jgi:hypothetical protein
LKQDAEFLGTKSNLTMTKRELFLELVQEIDYQARFTYEERVDLFNKYNIYTSIKFFNPIMVLSEYLFIDKGFRCSGMSHSGAVQTAFNKEFKEGVSKYINLHTSNLKFDYYQVFHTVFNPSRLVNKVSFRITDNEILIILVNIDRFRLIKGECMYERCNSFLRDFKYPEIF